MPIHRQRSQEDVDGQNRPVGSVNPAYLSSLGYTEAELIGRSFMSLVHPDDLEMTLAQVKNTAGGSTTVLLERHHGERRSTLVSVVGARRCPAWSDLRLGP
jgi:PAS domain S-box-containing protein